MPINPQTQIAQILCFNKSCLIRYYNATEVTPTKRKCEKKTTSRKDLLSPVRLLNLYANLYSSYKIGK